jgi:DNA-binding transcriptional LysR family regulator
MNTPEIFFLHVVEAGSFKRAAENLKVEPSTLSRKIAALEERLKAKLLHRSTSKTHPTEIGLLYYHGLRRITDEKIALEEGIFSKKNKITGKLRIGATVDFGEKFIVPVIRHMKKMAPELSIEMILGSDIDNLSEKNLDVAIRMGAIPSSSLFAKPIGDLPRVLVASPEYLKSNGVPNIPSDLINHNFVLYSALQAQRDIEFQDGSKFSHSKISSNIAVNSIRSIYELVKDGAGINWGPTWLYRENLENGTLIEVLPSTPVKGFSLHAVYTTREYLPYKTKMFIKLLSEKIKSDEC